MTPEEKKKNYSSFFHGLTNRQNIVSIKAGSIVALADKKDYASLSEEGLRDEVWHMLEELRLIEKAILEAGQFAHKIDDLTWPLLNLENPDAKKSSP